MVTDFQDKIKDLGMIQFCKKHNLQLSTEQENRVMEYMEIVRESPIFGLTTAQEKEIALGFIHNIPVDLYWRVNYSPELMKQLRECLENNIPVEKLMKRNVFSDADIKQITIIKSTLMIKRLMTKGKEFTNEN